MTGRQKNDQFSGLCVHTKFFKSIFYLSLHSLPFFWAKISRDDFGLTEKPSSYP